MKKSTFAGLGAFSCGAAMVSVIYYSGVMSPVSGTVHRRIPSDWISIGAALRMFEINMGRFPETAEGLSVLVNRPAGMAASDRWVRLMDRIPLDPWQKEYRYINRSKTSVEKPFELRSSGPDGVFDTEDDISSLED
ncbi:type II secretion system protein GspG [Haloferula chungangensis]|uniref:Type II secretion system protein GspG n=1 Tax=Haloferula chungangensis TaxID=1048331 RepID=A0ABW2LAI5_9BACT